MERPQVVCEPSVLSDGSLASLWALWLPSPNKPGSLTRSCESWVVVRLGGSLTGFFFASGFYHVLVRDGWDGNERQKMNRTGFHGNRFPRPFFSTGRELHFHTLVKLLMMIK